MKKGILFFCIFFRANLAIAQAFQGTIVYELQNVWVSDQLNEKQMKTLGYSVSDQLNGVIKVYQIKSDSLLQVATYKDGRIYDIQIQTPEDAYFAYNTGKKAQNYESFPKLKLEKADDKIKNEDRKYILGIECQKYTYTFKKDALKVEVWYADCFPFNKKSQTRQFMGNVFQKEGLIMECKIMGAEIENILQIKKISIHEQEVPLLEQIKHLNIVRE